MSRKEAISNLREVLIKRRDALRKTLAADLSSLRKDRPEVPDDPDLNCVEDGISSELVKAENQELAQVRYALERMQEERFGICEGCDINIPIVRLRAMPYAVYCIKCQREAERQCPTPTTENWSHLPDPTDESIDLSFRDTSVEDLP